LKNFLPGTYKRKVNGNTSNHFIAAKQINH
jgi:hypothetical protein